MAAVPAPPADTAPLPDGVGLIAAERSRQVSAEGWSAIHDDNEHSSGELEDAAICYLFANGSLNPETCPLNTRWPWDDKWWKPSNDPIRNLVKAGALVAAEIDRLQRLRRFIQPPADTAWTKGIPMADVRVGMRLRSTIEHEHGGPHEFITVTGLTEKGFVYSLNADVPLGPRYGVQMKDGNEHFGVMGRALYTIVEPVRQHMGKMGNP